MQHFIYQLEIFFFVFSVLYLLKYTLKAINVIRLQEGKIDNDTIDLIILGTSLSYVITMLYSGF